MVLYKDSRLHEPSNSAKILPGRFCLGASASAGSTAHAIEDWFRKQVPLDYGNLFIAAIRACSHAFVRGSEK